MKLGKIDWFKPEVRGYSLDWISGKRVHLKSGDFAKLKKFVANEPKFMAINVFDLKGASVRLGHGTLSVNPDGTVGGELECHPNKIVTVSIHETNKKMVARVTKIV